MRRNAAALLPGSLPPIGIDRVQAAEYVGVGVTLFDRMVSEGLMPEPRIVRKRLVWDVEELARAFRMLPHRAERVDPAGNEANPWD